MAHALADAADARVMVFVDGQNLYKRCDALFGHPLVNPKLLAQYLAGPRSDHPVMCRYYTGRPDHNIPGEATKARNVDRRLSAIRKTGVTVVTRPLRYHWDWGHRKQLPRPGSGVKRQKVTLAPWQRPQEKGIDVVMALEVVEFILTDKCDVAIVVSLDRDLAEIPRAVGNLKSVFQRPHRIEAAVPVSGGSRRAKTLAGFHFTHQITPEVFALVKDETDYTVDEKKWVPPTLPTLLAVRPDSADEAGEEATTS